MENINQEKKRKGPKPVKRTKKNVIKNLVKENQRIHDYDSPFGVKFWNKILKDSKYLAHNHKVFDKNLPTIIERDYAYYNRCLETETDEKKVEILKRKIYQLEYFLDDRWKTLFDDDARLKPDKREIIWAEGRINTYEIERAEKRRKWEQEQKDQGLVVNSAAKKYHKKKK
jgi:hypothetical protein